MIRVGSVVHEIGPSSDINSGRRRRPGRVLKDTQQWILRQGS